jgi:hypothetical protein
MLSRARIRRAFAGLASLSDVVLVHGDQRGADRLAAEVARREFGWNVEPHPARWELHGAAAGPIRNQEMVDTKPNLCVAFPTKPEGTRGSGTWDCVGRARRAGVSVLIA